MSDGVRTALVGLIGLLAIILGCLVVFGLVIRRQGALLARRDHKPQEGARSTPGDAARRGESSGGPLAVCSLCQGELEAALVGRPRAAGRWPLAGLEGLAAAGLGERQGPGSPSQDRELVCITCQRVASAAMRRCPHDGGDLVPVAVYQAARGGKALAAASARAAGDRGEQVAPTRHGGVRPSSIAAMDAKICPRCGGRYDYGATFCDKDGAQLVVLN